MGKIQLLVLCTGIFVVISLCGSTILTPLWLDSIKLQNSSDSSKSFRKSDVYFELVITNLTCLVPVSLLYLICSWRKSFSLADYDFPKLYFFGMGLGDAVSSMCFVFASSGNRLAPYLQALVTNFSVPVTFVVRFIILRKIPDKKKFFCTLAVLLALFISLIPNIFPSTVDTQSKRDNGGATGIASVLWPLCFAIGYIPRSLMNVLIEKSTKCVILTSGGCQSQIHSIYLIFWSLLFSLVCLLCLFGFDMIPGFGMASGPKDFIYTFLFNFKCFVGIPADGCKSEFRLFAYMCISFLLLNRFVSVWFLKLSEGANYLAVVQCLQMPVVVLFWTLFTEQPFQWNPHFNLGTLLAVVALLIMVPASVIYNTGTEISLSYKQNIRNLNVDNTSEETIPFFRTKRRNVQNYNTVDTDNFTSIDDNLY